ncbi:MAG: isochorismatase family cysteine hydrolase [Pseudomonadota bacterium]
MRGAILIIDMVKDVFDKEHGFPIMVHAKAIVPRVNEVNQWARKKGWPVIFSCDSFLKEDFIFKGKMGPHALRGTEGCMVTEELVQEPGDVYLPKRRFSGFFKTDLDQTLRTWEVDTVVVCGISTHFCVLTTAMDALCHDFKAIILEDATAAFTAEIHEKTLDLFRKNPLYPLFKIMTSEELYQLGNE